VYGTQQWVGAAAQRVCGRGSGQEEPWWLSALCGAGPNGVARVRARGLLHSEPCAHRAAARDVVWRIFTQRVGERSVTAQRCLLARRPTEPHVQRAKPMLESGEVSPVVDGDRCHGRVWRQLDAHIVGARLYRFLRSAHRRVVAVDAVRGGPAAANESAAQHGGRHRVLGLRMGRGVHVVVDFQLGVHAADLLVSGRFGCCTKKCTPPPNSQPRPGVFGICMRICPCRVRGRVGLAGWVC
jgi:hypothetical protein